MKRIILSAIMATTASSAWAETTILECPRVFTNNPYAISRTENSGGWQLSESSGAAMFIRPYVSSQGELVCAYRAAAHGASDIFTYKRQPPEGATCVHDAPSPRFKCTTPNAPPTMQSPVSPLPQRELRLPR